MTTAADRALDPSSNTDAEIPTSLLDRTIDLDHTPEDDLRDALGDKQVVVGPRVKEFFDPVGNLVGVWYCDPYSGRECYRGRMVLHRRH